ncbi:anthranilate synthase component I family protein [Cyanobium sp. WAJ14-Wanaka]|uniref:anthranilate synthase component I family protein n=1 Tax=Cyanobium sp. WAJ14-Wanaka TaxID=2823725 RepID=UPI0020CDB524|nr:anthranilate synthase component I family protein [Cyanobium sp. WAJ14-Wanaka]MCP9775490.1 anthranilate synthase component I family protein [Cyanobium sp. WAJ14-Wanaka]
MNSLPTKRLQRAMAWREPMALVHGLVAKFGREGLVWLDGDGVGQGRCSRIGINPLAQRVCRGLPGPTCPEDPCSEDPFAALSSISQDGGHWMGWLAYEAGAWVEAGAHWATSDMAVLWAARHDPILLLDHQEQSLVLEGSDPGRIKAMAELIEALPMAKGPHQAGEAANLGIPLPAWQWHTDPAAFARQVSKILEWIAAGDMFQANLTACCEFQAPATPDPLALYGRLRQGCPAPFGGLAIAGAGAQGEAVLSSSPERFLRLGQDGQVETRPIKGTRPRRSDAQADAAEAAALVTSGKDRAENVMIVDLLRNDLGRVCQPGSIGVSQLVGLESYRQVHHLTSVVRGSLQPERNLVDLLRACWPGGSISGAPKIRASQRLASLEPVPRGPYCGSLFWLAPDGQFDSNILIRSVVIKDQRLRVHAGCGIVADSDPAAEAEEMGWKLKPLLEALA